MKVKRWCLGLLFLGIVFTICTPTIAGDVLYRLTHNDQYALVLGTVSQVKKEEITLAVSQTLSGHWLWGKINIVNLPQSQVKLKAGTKLMVSVNRLRGGVLGRGAPGRQYTVQWGLYRVSSLNRGTLRILESILAPGDRAALERYIHSGGRDNDFFFIEGGAFLRYPDGTVTQIYPEAQNNQDRPLRKRVLIYCNRKTYNQVLSSTPGIGLYPVFINKMNRPVQYRWWTDYGMFLSWSAATYQVKQLGRETITAGETKIYWSLPLSRKPMGLTNTKLQLGIEGQFAPINNHLKANWHKNRARIGLNVTDQRTGKIIGEGVIFVICKEGTAMIEE